MCYPVALRRLISVGRGDQQLGFFRGRRTGKLSRNSSAWSPSRRLIDSSSEPRWGLGNNASVQTTMRTIDYQIRRHPASYYATPEMQLTRAMATAERSGFTMIELVVVIAIISILMSLLLPAVQQSQSAARRVECASRMRNVNLAMLDVLEAGLRFPACGNFTAQFGRHHSWVVDVLPWLDQADIANRWNKDLSIYDPVNEPLTHLSFPVLTCPADISVVPGQGNLSYVVNGGVGFTVFYNGVHDCPVDPQGRKLDLNGNGVSCPASGTGDGQPTDKDLFLRMGLFFNETWNSDITQRHHTAASVTDGLSNTVVFSENVRTGYNPAASSDPWSSSSELLT